MQVENDTGEMIVKRVSVPIGLEELMEGLTKEVILKKPKDIYVFASQYFAHLLERRDKGYLKGIPKRAQSVTKQIPSRFNKTKTRDLDPSKEVTTIKKPVVTPRRNVTPLKVEKQDKSTPKSYLDKRKARKSSSRDNSNPPSDRSDKKASASSKKSSVKSSKAKHDCVKKKIRDGDDCVGCSMKREGAVDLVDRKKMKSVEMLEEVEKQIVDVEAIDKVTKHEKKSESAVVTNEDKKDIGNAILEKTAGAKEDGDLKKLDTSTNKDLGKNVKEEAVKALSASREVENEDKEVVETEKGSGKEDLKSKEEKLLLTEDVDLKQNLSEDIPKAEEMTSEEKTEAKTERNGDKTTKTIDEKRKEEDNEVDDINVHENKKEDAKESVKQAEKIIKDSTKDQGEIVDYPAKKDTDNKETGHKTKIVGKDVKDEEKSLKYATKSEEKDTKHEIETKNPQATIESVKLEEKMLKDSKKDQEKIVDGDLTSKEVEEKSHRSKKEISTEDVDLKQNLTQDITKIEETAPELNGNESKTERNVDVQENKKEIEVADIKEEISEETSNTLDKGEESNNKKRSKEILEVVEESKEANNTVKTVVNATAQGDLMQSKTSGEENSSKADVKNSKEREGINIVNKDEKGEEFEIKDLVKEQITNEYQKETSSGKNEATKSLSTPTEVKTNDNAVKDLNKRSEDLEASVISKEIEGKDPHTKQVTKETGEKSDDNTSKLVESKDLNKNEDLKVKNEDSEIENFALKSKAEDNLELKEKKFVKTEETSSHKTEIEKAESGNLNNKGTEKEVLKNKEENESAKALLTSQEELEEKQVDKKDTDAKEDNIINKVTEAVGKSIKAVLPTSLNEPKFQEVSGNNVERNGAETIKIVVQESKKDSEEAASNAEEKLQKKSMDKGEESNNKKRSKEILKDEHEGVNNVNIEGEAEETGTKDSAKEQVTKEVQKETKIDKNEATKPLSTPKEVKTNDDALIDLNKKSENLGASVISNDIEAKDLHTKQVTKETAEKSDDNTSKDLNKKEIKNGDLKVKNEESESAKTMLTLNDKKESGKSVLKSKAEDNKELNEKKSVKTEETSSNKVEIEKVENENSNSKESEKEILKNKEENKSTKVLLTSQKELEDKKVDKKETAKEDNIINKVTEAVGKSIKAVLPTSRNETKSESLLKSKAGDNKDLIEEKSEKTEETSSAKKEISKEKGYHNETIAVNIPEEARKESTNNKETEKQDKSIDEVTETVGKSVKAVLSTSLNETQSESLLKSKAEDNKELNEEKPEKTEETSSRKVEIARDKGDQKDTTAVNIFEEVGNKTEKENLKNKEVHEATKALLTSQQELDDKKDDKKQTTKEDKNIDKATEPVGKSVKAALPTQLNETKSEESNNLNKEKSEKTEGTSSYMKEIAEDKNNQKGTAAINIPEEVENKETEENEALLTTQEEVRDKKGASKQDEVVVKSVKTIQLNQSESKINNEDQKNSDQKQASSSQIQEEKNGHENKENEIVVDKKQLQEFLNAEVEHYDSEKKTQLKSIYIPLKEEDVLKLERDESLKKDVQEGVETSSDDKEQENNSKNPEKVDLKGKEDRVEAIVKNTLKAENDVETSSVAKVDDRVIKESSENKNSEEQDNLDRASNSRNDFNKAIESVTSEENINRNTEEDVNLKNETGKEESNTNSINSVNVKVTEESLDDKEHEKNKKTSEKVEDLKGKEDSNKPTDKVETIAKAVKPKQEIAKNKKEDIKLKNKKSRSLSQEQIVKDTKKTRRIKSVDISNKREPQSKKPMKSTTKRSNSVDVKQTKPAVPKQTSFDSSKLREEISKAHEISKTSTFKTSYNPSILRQEIKNASKKEEKKDELKMAEAVLRIQALWRGFHVRRLKKRGELFGGAVEDRNEEEEELKTVSKKSAASKIQAAWRGYKVRKDMKEVDKRIADLQKPGECDEMPHQRGLRDEDIFKAASKIQAGVRGYMVRKNKKVVNKLGNIAEENVNMKIPDEDVMEALKNLQEVPQESPVKNRLKRSISVEETAKITHKLVKNPSTDSFKKYPEKLKTNSLEVEESYKSAPTRPVTSDVVEGEIKKEVVEQNLEKRSPSMESSTSVDSVNTVIYNDKDESDEIIVDKKQLQEFINLEVEHYDSEKKTLLKSIYIPLKKEDALKLDQEKDTAKLKHESVEAESVDRTEEKAATLSSPSVEENVENDSEEKKIAGRDFEKSKIPATNKESVESEMINNSKKSFKGPEKTKAKIENLDDEKEVAGKNFENQIPKTSNEIAEKSKNCKESEKTKAKIKNDDEKTEVTGKSIENNQIPVTQNERLENGSKSEKTEVKIEIEDEQKNVEGKSFETNQIPVTKNESLESIRNVKESEKTKLKTENEDEQKDIEGKSFENKQIIVIKDKKNNDVEEGQKNVDNIAKEAKQIVNLSKNVDSLQSSERNSEPVKKVEVNAKHVENSKSDIVLEDKTENQGDFKIEKQTNASKESEVKVTSQENKVNKDKKEAESKSNVETICDSKDNKKQKEKNEKTNVKLVENETEDVIEKESKITNKQLGEEEMKSSKEPQKVDLQKSQSEEEEMKSSKEPEKVDLQKSQSEDQRKFDNIKEEGQQNVSLSKHAENVQLVESSKEAVKEEIAKRDENSIDKAENQESKQIEVETQKTNKKPEVISDTKENKEQEVKKQANGSNDAMEKELGSNKNEGAMKEHLQHSSGSPKVEEEETNTEEDINNNQEDIVIDKKEIQAFLDTEVEKYDSEEKTKLKSVYIPLKEEDALKLQEKEEEKKIKSEDSKIESEETSSKFDLAKLRRELEESSSSNDRHVQSVVVSAKNKDDSKFDATKLRKELEEAEKRKEDEEIARALLQNINVDKSKRDNEKLDLGALKSEIDKSAELLQKLPTSKQIEEIKNRTNEDLNKTLKEDLQSMLSDNDNNKLDRSNLEQEISQNSSKFMDSDMIDDASAVKEIEEILDEDSRRLRIPPRELEEIKEEEETLMHTSEFHDTAFNYLQREDNLAHTSEFHDTAARFIDPSKKGTEETFEEAGDKTEIAEKDARDSKINEEAAKKNENEEKASVKQEEKMTKDCNNGLTSNEEKSNRSKREISSEDVDLEQKLAEGSGNNVERNGAETMKIVVQESKKDSEEAASNAEEKLQKNTMDKGEEINNKKRSKGILKDEHEGVNNVNIDEETGTKEVTKEVQKETKIDKNEVTKPLSTPKKVKTNDDAVKDLNKKSENLEASVISKEIEARDPHTQQVTKETAEKSDDSTSKDLNKKEIKNEDLKVKNEESESAKTMLTLNDKKETEKSALKSKAESMQTEETSSHKVEIEKVENENSNSKETEKEILRNKEENESTKALLSSQEKLEEKKINKKETAKQDKSIDEVTETVGKSVKAVFPTSLNETKSESLLKSKTEDNKELNEEKSGKTEETSSRKVEIARDIGDQKDTTAVNIPEEVGNKTGQKSVDNIAKEAKQILNLSKNIDSLQSRERNSEPVKEVKVNAKHVENNKSDVVLEDKTENQGNFKIQKQTNASKESEVKVTSQENKVNKDKKEEEKTKLKSVYIPLKEEDALKPQEKEEEKKIKSEDSKIESEETSSKFDLAKLRRELEESSSSNGRHVQSVVVSAKNNDSKFDATKLRKELEEAEKTKEDEEIARAEKENLKNKEVHEATKALLTSQQELEDKKDDKKQTTKEDKSIDKATEPVGKSVKAALPTQLNETKSEESNNLNKEKSEKTEGTRSYMKEIAEDKDNQKGTAAIDIPEEVENKETEDLLTSHEEVRDKKGASKQDEVVVKSVKSIQLNQSESKINNEGQKQTSSSQIEEEENGHENKENEIVVDKKQLQEFLNVEVKHYDSEKKTQLKSIYIPLKEEDVLKIEQDESLKKEVQEGVETSSDDKEQENSNKHSGKVDLKGKEDKVEAIVKNARKEENDVETSPVGKQDDGVIKQSSENKKSEEEGNLDGAPDSRNTAVDDVTSDENYNRNTEEEVKLKKETGKAELRTNAKEQSEDEILSKKSEEKSRIPVRKSAKRAKSTNGDDITENEKNSEEAEVNNGDKKMMEDKKISEAPPSLSLLHTGELHDTITVPISISPTSSSPSQVSAATASAAAEAPPPAGAAVLTSPASESVSIDGDAHASIKDASTCERAGADAVSMETEKRNNASTVQKKKSAMEVEAATKIQAGFRGYQVRKQMKNKVSSPGDISHQRRSSRRKSSGRLDSPRIAAQKPPKAPSEIEERSAVKIQAGVRGFLVRRRQKKTTPKTNKAEASP